MLPTVLDRAQVFAQQDLMKVVGYGLVFELVPGMVAPLVVLLLAARQYLQRVSSLRSLPVRRPPSVQVHPY